MGNKISSEQSNHINQHWYSFLFLSMRRSRISQGCLVLQFLLRTTSLRSCTVIRWTPSLLRPRESGTLSTPSMGAAWRTSIPSCTTACTATWTGWGSCHCHHLPLLTCSWGHFLKIGPDSFRGMKCVDDLVLLFSFHCRPLWMAVLDFLGQPEGKNWKWHETFFTSMTNYDCPLLLYKEV